MRAVEWILATLLILLMSGPAPAQEIGGSNEIPEMNDDRVRLKTLDNPDTWMEGRILDSGAGTTVLQTDSGPTNLVTDRITHLEVHRGSGGHAGTGAIIGGLAGGGFGLALGLSALNDPYFPVSQGEVIGATLVGAAAGALAGGLIGTAIRTDRWEEVDPVKIGLACGPGGAPSLAVAWRF